jgi:CelD/BcsL family acetyltransferase involved in cellulose biosynthesis
MKTEKLSKLRSAWNELFDSTSNATPFVSYEWFSTLAGSILETDPEVLVFVENSAIKGIIPATISGKMIKMIGDERVTDLVDMVNAPGYEAAIAEDLAEYIMEGDISIDLYPLEHDSPLMAGLEKHLPKLTIQEQDRCPLLDLPETWADYLVKLDGKLRHEMRRKMKKVNGAVIQDVKPTEMERFFEFMAGSHAKKKAFLTPEMIRFFEELIDTFYRRGWLRMRTAVFEGQTIGMLLGFGFKRRVYLYNMGFNPAFRTLSPGIVTIGLDIHSAIDDGFQYYDFLRGDEDYKFRLGAKSRYTVRLTT